MKTPPRVTAIILLLLLAKWCGAQTASAPPNGFRAVWDLARAWREPTPTRERLCINGLWRWQPSTPMQDAVPDSRWGYFKVPGCWPGITDYLQKDSQTVYPDPSWREQKRSTPTAAWYQREIEIPADWSARRIALSVECVNSFATVYLDGTKVGELRFPAGEIDLTAICRPGTRHLLSLHVIAMPLKAVRLSYADTAAAKEVSGTVERRGLCGDVYLVSTPATARLADVSVQTSVRRGKVTVGAVIESAAADAKYSLRAEILQDDHTVTHFDSDPFTNANLSDGRISFAAKWKPDQLWDLNTPQNLCTLRVSLLDAAGKVLDTMWDVRFGYREFWIDGRDFYLNGTRIFLSALPIGNAQISVAEATYSAARETMLRLKRIGINLVYTHNYGCEPGTHLSFEEILRAADDVGMLVSFSQPHFSQYDWKAPDADTNNGYARDAALYVRAAQNHPSVVFYSMSHNATGYEQDMDPDLIDGVHDPRKSANNVKLALRAEAIVRRLDPSRIVYHHAGGNIGAMHTINFYPNFAPVQELCDWFGHWATDGVKPLFLCEYGAPFTWDWTMYRGWYQGQREFGSAAVPWEFCLAEWDSQFLGDRAFAMQLEEKANIRWEAKQFAAGRVWHRWDYPTQVGSPKFEQRNQVMAKYIEDNWRAYRTWGVSGISPWEYEMFWMPRPGVDRSRKEIKTNWDNLQRPGFSPDYIDSQFEQIDTAFDFDDWIPTAAGKAVLRNNQPVLAYIAGGPDAFTAKDHNFLPGQTVEKQLIVINNSRKILAFHCNWSLGLPEPIAGQKDVTIETGQQARIPMSFPLPKTTKPGEYAIRTSVRFGNDQQQDDTFAIHGLPEPEPSKSEKSVALFDPRGETAKLLQRLGVAFHPIDANTPSRNDETLIIGKLALSADGPAPDISGVRDGLKTIVFEQSKEALEKRLGFRAVEYGLRQVFPRIPDDPILAGIDTENLRDWHGEATTTLPRLAHEIRPRYGPTIEWCDIPVTQIWRCGNRGNVASVLIEKPGRGDFRPVVDGGFSLQYSPLMEYREGKGMVLFCQLDVTARTEPDPAAEAIARNIFQYASAWKPNPQRRAIYVGPPEGKAHLKSTGIEAAAYDGGELPPDQVLILGPGAATNLGPDAIHVKKFITAGGRVLAMGLDQRGADAVLPMKVGFTAREHISTMFDPPENDSLLSGIGPADVELRAPRILLLVSGAAATGDGVLGSESDNIVICQLIPWQLDYKKSYNLKRTYRHSCFLLARLLGNLGVAEPTPLLDRFHSAVQPGHEEKRWLDGLYLDAPEEWDDPYRHFRW
jgi:beta-galactosidase